MVTPPIAGQAVWTGFSHLLLAQQTAEPLLERLDPPRRAAVVMALLALVLTGMLLVAIVVLGANWARRQARHRPSARRSSVHLAAGSSAQMRETLQNILPDARTDDTVQINRGDTKVDE